jgi:hypothetical protein
MKNAPLIDPYSGCDHNYDLISVPNGDANGLSISAYFRERIVLLKGRRRTHGSQARMRRRQGPGMHGPRRVNQSAESSLVEA